MAFCAKCGRNLENNEKFCGACGTPVPQKEESFEDQNYTDFNDSYTENDTPITNNKPKKRKKKLLIALIAVVTLIALLFAAYMIFFKKPEFAVYIKNGGIYYSDGTKDSFKVSSDYGDDKVYMTANGKYLIYSVEKDGDDILYIADVTDEDNDPERIKKDVRNVTLTADSKYVVFISNDSLYYYDISDKETEKLQAEVYSYTISSEGSRIVYTTEDGEDYKNVYMEELGENNQEKVGSGISYFRIDPQGDILYYVKNDDLYKREAGEEKVHIDSDIDYLFPPDSDGNIYYTKDNKSDDTKEDIYYYDGSDTKRICQKVDSASNLYIGDNYFLSANIDESTVLITNGKTKTVNEDIRLAGINKDATKLAYIEPENSESHTGTLYVIDIESDGFGKPEKIATDVSQNVAFTSMNTPIYMRDYDDEENMGTLYCGDDKVGSDVEAFIWLEDSYSILYITDSDDEYDTVSIHSYKFGSSTHIADDVANLSIDAEGNLYYITDYSENSEEGTLYYFDGGDSEKIDDDVSSLCQVLVPGSIFYDNYFN